MYTPIWIVRRQLAISSNTFLLSTSCEKIKLKMLNTTTIKERIATAMLNFSSLFLSNETSFVMQIIPKVILAKPKIISKIYVESKLITAIKIEIKPVTIIKT